MRPWNKRDPNGPCGRGHIGHYALRAKNQRGKVVHTLYCKECKREKYRQAEERRKLKRRDGIPRRAPLSQQERAANTRWILDGLGR